MSSKKNILDIRGCLHHTLVAGHEHEVGEAIKSHLSQSALISGNLAEAICVLADPDRSSKSASLIEGVVIQCRIIVCEVIMQIINSDSSAPECTILVVDDNSDDFELLQHQFASSGDGGFAIEYSDCLAAALSRLRLGGIDIVLLDLSLPDSQGVETVKKVRLSVPETPIIVLSGAEDKTFASESLKYGAEDYLIKGSFDCVSLVRSIKYALARHTAQATNERLATIVEASDDAIIGKTLNGTITSWNKGASKLLDIQRKKRLDNLCLCSSLQSHPLSLPIF